MSDHDALLRAIGEQPEEDTPRLMFADWLEENGQPQRADFVRTQVELARFSANDPARRPWVLKNVAYLRDFVPLWRAQLPQLPKIEWGDFNRGLIEEVLADSEKAVVEHAAAIFAIPGVHILRLRRLADARRLAALPELARLRSLRLVSAIATPDSLRALLASPHLGRLNVLDLHATGADDAVAADIADGRFPELAELWLGSNANIGNRGGMALANSPHLTKLRTLDLRGTRITDSMRPVLKSRFKKAVRL